MPTDVTSGHIFTQNTMGIGIILDLI